MEMHRVKLPLRGHLWGTAWCQEDLLTAGTSPAEQSQWDWDQPQPEEDVGRAGTEDLKVSRTCLDISSGTTPCD